MKLKHIGLFAGNAVVPPLIRKIYTAIESYINL